MGQKEKAIAEYLAVAGLLQNAGNRDRALLAVNQALKISPESQIARQSLALLRNFKPLPVPEKPRPASAGSATATSPEPVMAHASPSDQAQTPVEEATRKALTVLASRLFEGSEEDQIEVDDDRRGLQAILAGAVLLRKSADRASINLHLSQVVEWQARGQFAQAAEELQRAVDAGLEEAAAFFDLGFLYVQVGRIESALRFLPRALSHSDYALAARLFMAEILQKRGNIKDAAVEYLEALKITDAQAFPPDQARSLLQLYESLIELQRSQDDPTSQARLCDNIRTLLARPDWRMQLNQLRQQLPGRGEQSQPVPLATILLEVQSSQVVAMISEINAMVQQGATRSAMEEAFFALQEAPTYLPLHAIMGEILVRQGALEAAKEKFLAIARTYSVRGEAQQAVSLYRKVSEMCPADLDSRSRLVEQLTASGQLGEAAEETIHIAEVYYSLADLKTARRTYADAYRLAQQANAGLGLRIEILHRIADIDLQSLEWRQALRILEQIRLLQPDDAAARANLIDLNYRLNQEPQALAELESYLAYLAENGLGSMAEAFLQGLIAENPARIPIRRRLADYYSQQGKTTEAIAQLDAIGELYMQAGDIVHAIQIVESIIALNPSNRDDYVRLLKQLQGVK
jgi:tetratricopeptide (TPR) repeat protein